MSRLTMKEKLKIMREIEAANDERVDEWEQEHGQKKRITGVLVDVEKGTASVVTLDKDLEAYHKALNCSCIDIACRMIGNQPYDIICDDDGALIEGAIPSAVDYCGRIHLYGNLFVVKFDGKDDVESLTPADAAHVLRCARMWISHAKPDGYKLLWGVDYVRY